MPEETGEEDRATDNHEWVIGFMRPSENRDFSWLRRAQDVAHRHIAQVHSQGCDPFFYVLISINGILSAQILTCSHSHKSSVLNIIEYGPSIGSSDLICFDATNMIMNALIKNEESVK